MNKILLVLFTIFIVLSIFYFSIKIIAKKVKIMQAAVMAVEVTVVAVMAVEVMVAVVITEEVITVAVEATEDGQWVQVEDGLGIIRIILIIHIIRVQIAHLHLLLHLHRMKRNKCLVKV